jgi:CyaY protein
MTESEYNERIREFFDRLEQSLDDCAADIEWDKPNEAMIELTFANGSKMVINRQAAMQEIWVAAKAGGFHFAWSEGAWRDTRDGTELFAALSRHASEQSGEAVRLG